MFMPPFFIAMGGPQADKHSGRDDKAGAIANQTFTAEGRYPFGTKG